MLILFELYTVENYYVSKSKKARTRVRAFWLHLLWGQPLGYSTA